MKAGSKRLAAQVAVLAILMPAVARAGALEDKLRYCESCHGNHFQGMASIAPRLAGQQVEYLENQFTAISEHRRDNPKATHYMVPVIAGVPLDMRPEIAKHISELDAAPAGDGPKDLVAAGQKIFEEGLPDKEVPPCAGCHQPDAHGNGQFPRLAGQYYPYLVAQLTGWGEGYRSKDPVSAGDDNIMKPIASSLTKDQIMSVAAYLSYQR